MGKKLSKRYLMILLFPLGYLLNTLSRSNSVITERVYSNGVYRGISWVIGNLWGWLPFSLAELLLPVLVVVATWRIVVWVNRLIRSKGKRWIVLRNGILNILLVSSLVYFFFIALWGLNYNRQSLASILGLEVRPSTLDELIEMTEDLLEKTNSLREYVQEDEEGVVVLMGGSSEAFARARKDLRRLQIIFLADRVYRPKPMLFLPLVAILIFGILQPTAEPNVNMKIP